MLAGDWGWWRTVSHNLRVLPTHLEGRLPEPDVARVAERVDRLLRLVDAAPKSVRWKLRARAGDRIPWRDEPEERDER